eukprot:CAMPEP_0175121664 /NCGR_PEP_ID=MMETSP0087-20121206/1291_1 /TAXON_ID=136419 /ORGANISM="Unknown Unknown, Strain D1" /LENGTH=81 /DNA_ID=CAMNT_0016403225 /DNA_START=106 /DNA_END=351 /DNA_ORIENTATION=-
MPEVSDPSQVHQHVSKDTEPARLTRDAVQGVENSRDSDHADEHRRGDEVPKHLHARDAISKDVVAPRTHKLRDRNEDERQQ